VNLATRLFFLIALLIGLAVGSAIGITYWLGLQAAQDSIDRNLNNSQSIQQYFQERDLRELELISQLIASDRAFASYVTQALRGSGEESIDRRSILDLLNERSTTYGFDFALVLNSDGRLLVDTQNNVQAERDLSDAPVVSQVIETYQVASGLWFRGGNVLQVAAIPLTRGRTLEGFVVIGNQVSREFMGEIARVSGTDLAYTAVRDGDYRVAISTLDIGTRQSLQNVLSENDAIIQSVLTNRSSERAELNLAGEPWEAVLTPLQGSSRDGFLISLVPRERLFTMFRRIANSLLIAGIGALLVALIVSVVTSRRFLRPIETIATTAEDAVRGEYPRRIRSESPGEVGRLERAFNRLVIDLREQRAVETYFTKIWQQRTSRPGGPKSKQTESDDTEFPKHKIGEMLGGRYELLRLVGKGGMGIVYEARDTELDEIVALKLLKPAMLEDREKINRLKSEIRLARRITHPNVVRTYDFAEIDGQPMISMEYMRGITLTEALRDHGRVNFYAAVRLARQICNGISAAHEAGVLHRDIKPGNIIINYFAKVMDFGIAHPATRPFDADHRDAEMEGTPSYMSPEQLRGQETDERSDIYSLGIVLMEMFTGRLPHVGRDTMEVAMAHIEQPPFKPSYYWPDVPPSLESLVLTCLEKSPADRFQTVAEVAEELERVSQA
jgi:tRNA A-37 threonylcarbamoyl transferase component Bud32/HAMP domain-containing protein